MMDAYIAVNPTVAIIAATVLITRSVVKIPKRINVAPIKFSNCIKLKITLLTLVERPAMTSLLFLAV
jgi:hypothetical protein